MLTYLHPIRLASAAHSQAHCCPSIDLLWERRAAVVTRPPLALPTGAGLRAGIGSYGVSKCANSPVFNVCAVVLFICASCMRVCAHTRALRCQNWVQLVYISMCISHLTLLAQGQWKRGCVPLRGDSTDLVIWLIANQHFNEYYWTYWINQTAN